MGSLFPLDSVPQLLLHPPNTPNIPLALRTGDYNIDGYPDLLLIISNATAIPASGVFGTAKPGTQIRVLENIRCGKQVPGCDNGQSRSFKVRTGKGWEVLGELWDVTGASWLDVDSDVSNREVALGF